MSFIYGGGVGLMGHWDHAIAILAADCLFGFCAK